MDRLISRVARPVKVEQGQDLGHRKWATKEGGGGAETREERNVSVRCFTETIGLSGDLAKHCDSLARPTKEEGENTDKQTTLSRVRARQTQTKGAAGKSQTGLRGRLNYYLTGQ